MDVEVRIRHVQDDWLSRRCVASRWRWIHRQTNLVAPGDLSPFPCSPRLNGGIGFLQPLPYLLGILIEGEDS